MGAPSGRLPHADNPTVPAPSNTPSPERPTPRGLDWLALGLVVGFVAIAVVSVVGAVREGVLWGLTVYGAGLVLLYGLAAAAEDVARRVRLLLGRCSLSDVLDLAKGARYGMDTATLLLVDRYHRVATPCPRDHLVLLRWLRSSQPIGLYVECLQAGIPDAALRNHLNGTGPLDVDAVAALAALAS